MPFYRATRRVRGVGGIVYGPGERRGDAVPLSEDEAAQLARLGAISEEPIDVSELKDADPSSSNATKTNQQAATKPKAPAKPKAATHT